MSTRFATVDEVLAALPEDAMATVRTVAARIAREFGAFTTPDDLLQEFLLWLTERPHRAADWFYTRPGEDGVEVEQFGWHSFRRDTAAIMARAARRDKATALGYEPGDEQFYGLTQVKELLPHVWDDIVLEASGGPEVHTSNSTDPATSGGRMAAAADIRSAYEAVVKSGSAWDLMLESIYRLGATQAEVAEAQGVTQQAVAKRHRRALEMIRRELNGTLPIADDGPGSRRALSNAQAHAATRTQEDG